MKKVVLLMMLIFISHMLSGWEFEHDIYISGEYMRSGGDNAGEFFLEYYPSLQKQIYKSGNITLDSNIELMSRGALKLEDEKEEGDLDLELYRLWLRSTAEQSEFRIGLQKINFGPAMYLRSLQWFDRINALDPRQQTEGIWSMLMRYYTLDNSNYWFWAIYNETELKGQELVKTRDKTLEMGGRIQLPIFGGDVGFSYHNRGLQNEETEAREGEVFTVPQEKRAGVDGRWDIGIGLWLESSISMYEEVVQLPLYMESYTLGGDYTFGIGNGLHLLYEHQYIRTEESFWTRAEEEANIGLLAADYPIGLYDKLMGIVSFDHVNKDIYYYLSYNLVYKYVSIFFNLSVSPEDTEETATSLSIPGKTFQILMQLNY